MRRAYFRFFGELNQFLPAPCRQQELPLTLNGPVAVKHSIESLGVPHTEVALILADGQAVDFSFLVPAGTHFGIYPEASLAEMPASLPLRPPLPFPPSFVLDGHLGRLATYLRLLGFDCLYRHDYEDEELALISARTGRVLLTRDRRLLMRRLVIYGFCLHTRDPRQQLLDVLRRFALAPAIRLGRRCPHCNGVLQPVAREAIWHRLEPKTKRYYDTFQLCPDCSHIYWKGSHYERMSRFVAGIRAELR